MGNGQQSFLGRVFGKTKTVAPIDLVLQERLVRVVYQPIVDLKTKKVFGYEALARSSSPLFEGPLDLFAAAIEAGRVGELGRLLRMMAVDGCTEYPLFINVNPNEFDQGWLVQPNDPI